MISKSLAAALSLTLLGCFARGPAFSDYDPVGPDEGRLYVYRSPTLAFWGGPNTDPPVERRVRVGRGKAVFCGFFSGMNLIWRHWRIECTDEAEAHPDLRECKRQNLDEDSPWKP